MKRRSNVILRVYESSFEDERGKGKTYRVRTFGTSKLDRIVLYDVLKHHFEGYAEEEDIPHAIWQTTSSEDWESFASKLRSEWTDIQRATYDSAIDLLYAGSEISRKDLLDYAACFVDGYESGYKQAQEEWGLPVKSALYPEGDR